MAKFNVLGRYFTVENRATGTLLTVKEGIIAPRAQVVTWKEHKGENQVWYVDPLTDTIRSRQSHLCLDLDVTGRLILNPYEREDINQKWRYNKQRDAIENHGLANTLRALDVPGGSKTSGAEVVAKEFSAGNTQKWDLDGLPIQYFTIKSLFNDKIVDILGGKTSAGSRLILWDQKPKIPDSQLWFEDSYGNIRSKLSNKLVLDGNGFCVITSDQKQIESPRSYWVISGNKIVNKENHNEVIGVKDRLKLDGAELSVGLYRGDPSQHWSFDYITQSRD